MRTWIIGLIALTFVSCGGDSLTSPTPVVSQKVVAATPVVPVTPVIPVSPVAPLQDWTVALSGPSGYDCPGARILPQLEKKTFTFTTNINQVPEAIVVQAFWHYTSHATCDAINDAPIGLKIIGPNVFGVDEFGSFDVDLEPFACGAGQIDIVAISQKTRKELPGWRFFSGVYNTFKECLAPPVAPPVPPSPPVAPVPPIPPVVPPLTPTPPVTPPVPPVVPPDDDPPSSMPNCVYGSDSGLSDVHVSDDGTTYSFRVREGYRDVPLRLTSYEGHDGHVPPDRPQKLIDQTLKVFQPGTYTWSIRSGCQTDLHCTADKANDILWPGDYDGLYIASSMHACPLQ